jgi:peptidoglycan L-alanyl-D-glutamate endopeptidase CwlK
MDTRKIGLGAAVVGVILLIGRKLMDSNKPVKGMSASMPYIKSLHPSIQGLAKDVLQDAANQGLDLVITFGNRTNEQQAALYAQGRTAPGPIVTNAPPGSSWHNFGLAFDVAVLVNGKPTWPTNEALWQKIGAIGKARGLTWGGDFTSIKDRPHFEYHPGITLADARAGTRPSGSAIV